MIYSHEPSTPAHYAELLAVALESGEWDPSPTVIGDVAMTSRRMIGETVAVQTVTLYPEFIRGRAKGSVSSSITWVDSDAKIQHRVDTAWFGFDEKCDVLALRHAISAAFQAITPIV